MATVDLTSGSATKLPISADGHHYILKKTLDFDAVNYTAADILELLDIPAKTLVPRVQYDVETAEGGTFTFDLGDGADPNGYHSAIDGNAVGSGVNTLALTEAAPNTVTAYSNGKYYATTDTIDMVVNHNVDAGKIHVRVECIELNF